MRLTPYLLAGLLILAVAKTVFAADGCEPLRPNPPRNLSEEVIGKIDAKMGGLTGHLINLGGNLDGRYKEISSDVLKDYPNADHLYIWDRLLYIECRVMLDSTALSDQQKSDDVSKLMDKIDHLPKKSSQRKITDRYSFIQWRFPTGTTAADADSIFGVASGSRGYFVVSYCFSGRNISDNAITGVSAYVKPRNLGRELALKLSLSPHCGDRKRELSLSHIAEIEPKAEFYLVYDLVEDIGNNFPALTIREYLQRFGGFVFEFSCDNSDATLVHEFKYADLKGMLSAGEAATYNANRPPPRVILKN